MSDQPPLPSHSLRLTAQTLPRDSPHKFRPFPARSGCQHDWQRGRKRHQRPATTALKREISLFILKAKRMGEMDLLERKRDPVKTNAVGAKQGAQQPVQMETKASIWEVRMKKRIALCQAEIDFLTTVLFGDDGFR